MRVSDTEAAQRVADNDNLVGELVSVLKTITDNAEQNAFEDWLERICPSGDVTEVQRRWKDSGAYIHFSEEWGFALDAIAKAQGAQQ